MIPMKEKILLLNPPGKESYLRDYFCNNISKSTYLHYPIDLLLLTGTLKNKGYEIEVLDAMIKGYSVPETLDLISKIKPDYLVALVGTISWDEDKEFLQRLKIQEPKIKIIGTGDVFLDEGPKVINENQFLDGCILDFSDGTIIKLINKLNRHQTTDNSVIARSVSDEAISIGIASPSARNDQPSALNEQIDNCIYKENGSDPIVGQIKRTKGEFSIPIPLHEYFPIKEYKYAFSRNFPTAHILTDFGCAFNCSFCPIRIENLGFKVRPVSEVIEELKYLKSLGIKELYFRDQTFGANKKRAIELCERIVQEKLNFSWHCFSRVDVINEELLDAMKASGCHTIIFGIESINEKTLQDVKKRIDAEKIKNAFSLTKSKQIRRAATFIIGLPGETEEDIMRTVDFAIEIDCSFASFNIVGIRPGTDWSHHKENVHFLPYHELDRIRNKAIRRFYLRGDYILGRMLEISTLHDANVLFEEGSGIIVNLLRSALKLAPTPVKSFE